MIPDTDGRVPPYASADDCGTMPYRLEKYAHPE